MVHVPDALKHEQEGLEDFEADKNSIKAPPKNRKHKQEAKLAVSSKKKPHLDGPSQSCSGENDGYDLEYIHNYRRVMAFHCWRLKKFVSNLLRCEELEAATSDCDCKTNRRDDDTYIK